MKSIGSRLLGLGADGMLVLGWSACGLQLQQLPRLGVVEMAQFSFFGPQLAPGIRFVPPR
jgi:hypothetical protein